MNAAPILVDAAGRPVRASDATRCPKGHGPEDRVASSGFGEPHPVCKRCGYEFLGEPFVPDPKEAA